MSSGNVASYYDRLGRWNRAARAFGFGGGHTTLTVHRALADPAAGGRATFTRLHDLLLERIPARPGLRVLDAGCGLGGTMVTLAVAREATCLGLTLSESQASVANAAAERHGLSTRVQALVRSYDNPPPGPFDLVVAIESLAHSPDPATTVRRLASALAPAGVFVIVDDMPEASAESLPDLSVFKHGWQCPVLLSESAYGEVLAKSGMRIDLREDLTSDCRPRTLSRISQLMWLNRFTHRLSWSRALQHVMDSHQGGLALERLLRGGHVRYRMLIASKPNLQVS